MADTLHQITLESSSGTITGFSDQSTTTLTSQVINNVGPVLSLLVDPTVSLTDLKEKSKFKRKKAASSEDILTSHKQTYLRGYSSMDALNDSYKPTSVVESAVELWEGIVCYLKTHLHAGRRRPSWTIRSYHDCFFGSEISSTVASYMREVLREDVPILSDIKSICSKLIASGVIKSLREEHNHFSEDYLYQFPSSHNETNQGHTTTLSPHQRRSCLRPVGRETLKRMSNVWQTCRKHLHFQRGRSRSLTLRVSSPATRNDHQERATTDQKWHLSSKKPPIRNVRHCQQVHHEYRDHEYRDHEYRDHEYRDHGCRDHEYRDHEYRDHEYRDHGYRDHEYRDHGYRDHEYRDHEYRDREYRDHEYKDRGHRDHGYSNHVYKSSSFTTLTSYTVERTHTGNNTQGNNSSQWIVYGFV